MNILKRIWLSVEFVLYMALFILLVLLMPIELVVNWLIWIFTGNYRKTPSGILVMEKWLG